MRYLGLKTLSFFFVTSIFFNACNNKPKIVKSDKEIQKLQEPVVEVNRFLVNKDEAVIKKYAERRNWDMNETETGLWYMIYEKGNGDSIVDGDIVTLEYELSLLDGTVCYNTDTLGAETIIVGHGDMETGLYEGLLLLHKGDKARLIMPPHLAHGLLGDRNKIPSRSTIIFDLNILDVRKNK